jgi:short-subunit dehydrogenase
MRRADSILITGASSGIGAALARAYARPRVRLALTGRHRERLAGVAAACTDAGAIVIHQPIDITDEGNISAWIREVDDALTLDLVIANAGVTGGHRGAGDEESLADLQRIMAVNFFGATITAHAVIPAMRRRRRGQIAFISSIAALRGLPYSPAYCASKAALNVYGESLRAWLRPEGIEIAVVLPGFVDTPMAARVAGPKPFMISAERAARIIRRGLARGRTRIAFPRLLDLGQRAIAAFPAAPVDFILNRIAVGIRRSD